MNHTIWANLLILTSSQNREMEMKIEDLKEQTKEAEDLTDHQTKQEDKYDDRMKKLSEELKEEDVRAEFGERTVEKLESTIDSLEEILYKEKLHYRSISLKIDQTLKDMMELQHTIWNFCEDLLPSMPNQITFCLWTQEKSFAEHFLANVKSLKRIHHLPFFLPSYLYLSSIFYPFPYLHFISPDLLYFLYLTI